MISTSNLSVEPDQVQTLSATRLDRGPKRPRRLYAGCDKLGNILVDKLGGLVMLLAGDDSRPPDEIALPHVDNTDSPFRECCRLLRHRQRFPVVFRSVHRCHNALEHRDSFQRSPATIPQTLLTR